MVIQSKPDVHFMTSGRNILGFFGFAKILLKFEGLRSGQKIPEHVRELETLRLPQVVAIGLENAGKSTIVERITGVEVLPRDKDFCSRIAVIIQLRHDPNCPFQEPRLKLTLPNFGNDELEILENVACEKVRASIRALNEEIKRRGLGIEMDKFVTLELSSEGVPTMNLVDLPGIIAVRCLSSEEPADLSEKTEKLSLKYLCQDKTGGALCVIDATIDGLRSSKTIRLLQDAQGERLNAGGRKLNAVVIMTKADKAYDNSWEDEERNGPLWLLEERLLGLEDAVEIAPDIQGGFVALKNRSTQSRRECGIIGQNEEELKWFLSNFSLRGGFILPPQNGDMSGQRQLSALGKRHLGLPTLVERFDWIISNHLYEEWVPRKLAEQDQEETHVREQLVPLGLAPEDVGLERLREYVSAVLARALAPNVLDELSAASFEGLETSTISCPTLYETTCEVEAHLVKYREAITTNALMKSLAEKVQSVLISCFEEDLEEEILLFRFNTLHADLLSVLKHMLYDESRLKNFKAKALQCCDKMELKSCCQKDNLDWVFDFKQLQVMLSACMMIHFLKPVLHETSGIIPTTFGKLYAMPSECAGMAARRADLLGQLENVELIRNTLKDLSKIR